MYATILIPTDGSDASMATVEDRVDSAARFDATVRFLHVVDLGTETSLSAVGTIAVVLSGSLEQTADQALEAAMERADGADGAADGTTLEGSHTWRSPNTATSRPSTAS